MTFEQWFALNKTYFKHIGVFIEDARMIWESAQLNYQVKEKNKIPALLDKNFPYDEEDDISNLMGG